MGFGQNFDLDFHPGYDFRDFSTVVFHEITIWDYSFQNGCFQNEFEDNHMQSEFRDTLKNLRIYPN